VHKTQSASIGGTHHLGGIMYWEQSLDPTDVLLDAIRRGLQ